MAHGSDGARETVLACSLLPRVLPPVPPAGQRLTLCVAPAGAGWPARSSRARRKRANPRHPRLGSVGLPSTRMCPERPQNGEIKNVVGQADGGKRMFSTGSASVSGSGGQALNRANRPGCPQGRALWAESLSTAGASCQPPRRNQLARGRRRAQRAAANLFLEHFGTRAGSVGGKR